MTRSVDLRLWDIISAIKRIRGILDTETRESFLADSVKTAAVTFEFMIISEASRHIPDHYKVEHPNIPWGDIAGLGNIVRHVYFHVDPNYFWDSNDADLLELEAAVNSMIDLERKANQ